MKAPVSGVLILGLWFSCGPPGPPGPLESSRSQIEQIASAFGGRVGVGVVDVETGDTLAVDGRGRYPMQSVYKFPLALAVLRRVDEGALTLDQKIHVRKSDLRAGTWSPLREKYPEGDVMLSLAEVITATVSLSDNNGCDMLFRLTGGPADVEAMVHSLGVTGISIVSTEQEMHQDASLQYRNWCSPEAMAQLLRKFHRGEVLSEANTSFLRQVMQESPTGPRRLKGLLPAGTTVAHKTGSSGADKSGRIAATNDVGVVTLPDGRHVAIAVFVSDATAEEQACEEVIAQIAKAVWSAYGGRQGENRH